MRWEQKAEEENKPGSLVTIERFSKDFDAVDDDAAKMVLEEKRTRLNPFSRSIVLYHNFEILKYID